MKNTQLLRHHQLKATPQRLAIIELMHHAGHISIEDLYCEVKKRFSSISLATLYKNIHTMLDVALVREVKIPGQKTKYEIAKESHAHVLCRSCHHIMDIPLETSSLLKQSVDMAEKYTIEEISVVLSGLCPECQKK